MRHGQIVKGNCEVQTVNGEGRELTGHIFMGKCCTRWEKNFKNCRDSADKIIPYLRQKTSASKVRKTKG